MNSCIVATGFLTKALLNDGEPSLPGVEFEAFLRRTAEEILDCAVRELISEADRIVFEVEASDVTVQFVVSSRLCAKCVFIVTKTVLSL